MGWFRVLAVRLLALFQKSRAEDEMAEEFQCHLAMEIEENLSRGMSPEDARSAAMRSFGGMDQAKEACRDQRGFPFLEAAWWDLVFGIRLLRKSPGFTAVAVLTLALGIGANTAIFSVINAVILHPMPYRDAGRLVYVWETFQKYGQPYFAVSPANFLEWKEQNKVFEDMAVIVNQRVTLTPGGEPAKVEGQRVSANFFPLLGVAPLLGRTFAWDEDRPGSDHVVILSHRLWQSRFGGDPSLIGKSLTINFRA